MAPFGSIIHIPKAHSNQISSVQKWKTNLWVQILDLTIKQADQLKISQVSIHHCTYRFQELVFLLCFNIHEGIYLKLNQKGNSITGGMTKKLTLGKSITDILISRWRTRLKRLLSNADFEFCRSCQK
jgi:hypothetical protein